MPAQTSSTLTPLLGKKAQLQLSHSKMVREIARADWDKTSVGKLDGWSPALLNAARLVLSSSAPMALLIGRDGVLICNDTLAEMFGTRYAGSIGKSIFDILPHASEFYRHVIADCYQGDSPNFRDQELKLDRGSTPAIAWFDLNFTPVRDDNGVVHGILAIAAETSERLLAAQALQRSEERLSLALSASGMVGIWDLDLASNRLVIDEQFARLFAIDPAMASQGIDHKFLTAAIHSDDRCGVESELDKAMKTRGEFRSRFRVTDAHGACRWVIASGRPIAGVNGAFDRLPGVVVDITAQVEAVAALAESEIQFQTITESLPQIVWSTDADGRYNYLSQRWYEFTGIEAGLSGESPSLEALFHPDDRDRVIKAWSQARITGQTYDIDYRFRHRSGIYRWMRVMALPLRDRGDRVTRWFGTATDIHEARLLATERELVSRQLDHRIKNIFALFSGLISLATREEPEMRTFGDRLNGRVLALHAAHNFLKLHAGVEGARRVGGSLKGLIELLLTPYGGTQISVEGIDLQIDERAATPLSLMLHELSTNAAKYGGLAAIGFGVQITLTQVENTLQIIWKEATPSTKGKELSESGFGSKFLRLTVEGQLDGKLAYEWQSDGLHVEINIPCERIVAAPNASPAESDG